MLKPFDSLERAVDFDDRANDMQLRPWQWEFLLAADGRTPLRDLAQLCGIDFETAAELARETEALGLVGIVTLSLDAYRASAAALVRPVVSTASTTLFEAAPLPLAAPRKPVSLSFDSFSTFDTWDAPEAIAAEAQHDTLASSERLVFPDDIFAHEDFPAEPLEHEPPLEQEPLAHEVPHEAPPHEALAAHDDILESPLLDTTPIDFEFPDHMVSLGDRVTHVSISKDDDSYADVFAETPITNGVHSNGVHSNGVHANGSTAYVGDAIFEVPYTPAEHVEAAHDEFTDFELEQAAVTDTYFSPPEDFAPREAHLEGHHPLSHDDFPNDVEHHDEPARDPFAPLQPFVAEPVAAPVIAKKTVSFTLSADSFGLPNVPSDGMNFDSQPFDESIGTKATHDVSHEPALSSESASNEPAAAVPPKDDVLLQHFNVGGEADTGNGTNGNGSATSDLRNDDLTGVFLRVLGLKK